MSAMSWSDSVLNPGIEVPVMPSMTMLTCVVSAVTPVRAGKLSEPVPSAPWQPEQLPV